MVLVAPLLTKKKLIRVTNEVTKGTAVAGTADLLVFDLETNVDAQFTERKASSGFLGHTAPGIVDGIHSGTCSFTAELKGTDVAALNATLAILLQACGWKKTLEVYTPVSVVATMKTVSINVWEDGKKKLIRGAMGTAVFKNEAGGRVVIEFTFTGIWTPPVDEALPTPTFSAIIPARSNAAAGVFTLGGQAVKIANWEFDLGNEVVLRAAVNAQGGAIHGQITGRDPMLSIDPEDDKIAGYDFYGLWLAGTTQVVSLAVTNGTDTFTLSIPKYQFKEAPAQADRDGIMTLDVAGQCVANAGDDEYDLTVT